MVVAIVVAVAIVVVVVVHMGHHGRGHAKVCRE